MLAGVEISAAVFPCSPGPIQGWATKGVLMTLTMSVVLADDTNQTRGAVAGFLAGYRGSTRRSYATDLRLFAAWCATLFGCW